MYLWNIFKALIYLLFCSKKYAYSEQKDEPVNFILEPVHLNITSKSSKHDYDYNITGNTETYTANKGFGIASVHVTTTSSSKCTTLWRAISKIQYAEKVVITSYYYKNMKDLRVFTIDGQEQMYIRKYNEPWTEVDLARKIFVHLIIETMHDTYSYNTSGNDNYRTFEAKSPFIFWKIINLSSQTTKIKIWNASNPNECAYKVIINNPGVGEKTNKITIFSSNGTIKHLELINFKWVEIFPWTVLNISHKESMYEYQYFKNERKVECFIPNGNFLFKAIWEVESQGLRNMNIEVWRGTNSKYYARMVFQTRSPNNHKYLVLILATNEFIVLFRSPKIKIWRDRTNEPGIIKTLKGLGINLDKFLQIKEEILRAKLKPRKPARVDYEKWMQSLPFLSQKPETKEAPAVPEPAYSPEPIKLIILDIAKMYGYSGYQIHYIRNKVIFIADQAYLFLRVQKGKELIWTSKDGYHPYQVVYKEVDGFPEIKVYLPDFKPTDQTPNP